jgi:acetyl esterase/lipase
MGVSASQGSGGGRQQLQDQRRRQSLSAATFWKVGVPIVLLLSVFAIMDPWGSLSGPLVLKLWNGRAAIGDETYEGTDATITIYLAKGKHTSDSDSTTNASQFSTAAVVICPGGGFSHLDMKHEGHLVARWLNAHGITAIVLKYRLPKQRSLVPLLDAQRAIRTVRANAVEWQVDPSRIGIMGFSAGGHVAGMAGMHFDGGNPNAVHLVDRASCRPDFLVLVYPVVTMGTGKNTHAGSRINLLGPTPTPEQIQFFSLETQITAQTPPVFLAHALDDVKVPSDNSRVLFEALQANRIPSRYLKLPSGGHGLNHKKGPMWDAWQKQALEWLVELQFVSSVSSKQD